MPLKNQGYQWLQVYQTKPLWLVPLLQLFTILQSVPYFPQFCILPLGYFGMLKETQSGDDVLIQVNILILMVL